MSRQMKNGKCSCWKKIDKELAEHNTQLFTAFGAMSGHIYLTVATLNVIKSRKPAKRVFASFCPFCGKKLKDVQPSTKS